MLQHLLSERKAALMKRWTSMVLQTYPDETAAFLRDDTDRFCNPVGHTLREGLQAICSEMVTGGDRERLAPHIDDIVRLRAVQELAPSAALLPFVLLKHAIRQELSDLLQSPQVREALTELEDRIDTLVLQAFDVYMSCREKVYEIQAREVKNRTAMLVQRLNRAAGKHRLE